VHCTSQTSASISALTKEQRESFTKMVMEDKDEENFEAENWIDVGVSLPIY
jgi:tagatose-1,6-bisphosphate aldolase